LKNRVFFSFTATTLKKKQNEWLQNLEFSNPLFEERSKMAHSLLKKSYTLFVGPCFERKRRNRLVHCWMDPNFQCVLPFGFRSSLQRTSKMNLWWIFSSVFPSLIILF
jgi:hypothetical protein